MLHITDLKKYTRCPRIYYNSTLENTNDFNRFVRVDEEISTLACRKLGIEHYFLGKVGDDPGEALAAMNEYDWLVKARFAYEDLRIKVPFLHKTDKGWELYFLFTGIYPHANDMQFYCDTAWVLEQNGIHICAYYLIHLNAEYVRGDELDPQQLFTVSDSFYNNNNHPTMPIEEQIEKYKKDLRPLMQAVRECSEDTIPAPVRTSACTGRLKCRYYHTCFKNEKEEPDNSILNLISAQYRYNMKKEGRLFLKDADEMRIEGSRQQFAQIQADRNGGLFVDRTGLKSWLSNITYPISFLDFEWERFAIPPYKGMKPYDVLPFEYALYVLQEDGSYTHKTYLNVHDDRRDMAESLIRDIPETGSIVAYNAYGAEMVRIQEFADLFPDLSESLLKMNARMEDMQIPFVSGTVYDTRMKGQWSLKVIMSMMDDPGYQDLDIRQGMDAVYQWRHLDYGEAISDEEKEKIVEDLKKYCGMDAYAMTVVYKWLKKICEDREPDGNEEYI